LEKVLKRTAQVSRELRIAPVGAVGHETSLSRQAGRNISLRCLTNARCRFWSRPCRYRSSR
jgi:hypothetical protein